MTVAAENAVIRPSATIAPMASATLQVPYIDMTTPQAAGVSPYFGGVQMKWTGEAQTAHGNGAAVQAGRVEGVGAVRLGRGEPAAAGRGRRRTSPRAPWGGGSGVRGALDVYLSTVFGLAAAWAEDYACLQGDGVAKPQGIVNSPASATVTRATGGADPVRRRLRHGGEAAAVELRPCLLGAFAELRAAIVVAQGRDGAGGAAGGRPGDGVWPQRRNWSLLGFPMFCSEKLPPLGTKGDLILIDPRYYLIGDRMQATLAVSDHMNFLKNQVTFRLTRRCDGQPWIEKPITLQDGTATVSPFVVLNCFGRLTMRIRCRAGWHAVNARKAAMPARSTSSTCQRSSWRAGVPGRIQTLDVGFDHCSDNTASILQFAFGSVAQGAACLSTMPSLWEWLVVAQLSQARPGGGTYTKGRSCCIVATQPTGNASRIS